MGGLLGLGLGVGDDVVGVMVGVGETLVTSPGVGLELQLPRLAAIATINGKRYLLLVLIILLIIMLSTSVSLVSIPHKLGNLVNEGSGKD